jgi:ABC-2 type transport system ATP-binding protein
VLLTSHDLGDVEKVADRIAILDRGRIVGLGTPAELAGAGEAAVRFRLDRRLETEDLVTLARDVAAVLGEGDRRYRFDGVTGTPALISALTSWCAERGILVVELRVGGATLEERYLELVRGPQAPS